MRKQVNLILFILVAVFVFGIISIHSGGVQLFSSKKINVQVANVGQSLLQFQWTLLSRVEDCQKELENSPPLEFVEIRGELARKQKELCVLNIATGDIFLKRYWLEEKDVDRAETLRRMHLDNPNNLPRFMPLDPSEEFEVTTHWWNNWASNLSIGKISSTSNDVYIVTGNKFLMPDSIIIYPEDETGPDYSDVVFVSPYSEGLHDTEIVQAGKDYINDKVDAVFRELLRLKIESRASPGQLLAYMMDKTFVKEILITEQTDPDNLLNKAQTDEERRIVASKVLIRYALNGDKSYRYTVSRANAWGIAQIVAGTYKEMLGLFPSANLMTDVDMGRLDPHNAIKAQILVLDNKLAEVKERVNMSGSRAKQVFNNLTQDQIEEVMAMGYNGGSTKYNLSTGSLRMGLRGSGETKLFLEKLKVIRELELFN